VERLNGSFMLKRINMEEGENLKRLLKGFRDEHPLKKKRRNRKRLERLRKKHCLPYEALGLPQDLGKRGGTRRRWVPGEKKRKEQAKNLESQVEGISSSSHGT